MLLLCIHIGAGAGLGSSKIASANAFFKHWLVWSRAQRQLLQGQLGARCTPPQSLAGRAGLAVWLTRHKRASLAHSQVAQARQLAERRSAAPVTPQLQRVQGRQLAQLQHSLGAHLRFGLVGCHALQPAAQGHGNRPSCS